MAVGIQRLNAINAFRHLVVALAQFGAGHTAGGLNVIVADEAELAAVPGPEFQFLFLFQRDKGDFLGRVRHLGLGEVRGEFAGRVWAINLQGILDGPLARQLRRRDVIRFAFGLGLGFGGGGAGRVDGGFVPGAGAE